ncbi:MAG: sigma-70 family RNA polymerase sigma factor [Alphaproteobacteria bacterium]|nr:sigma-70 family RNA polymerase sigma factor [Alphaproteobacteria bacterium]MBU6472967.1 sigma-70 family RNA polymerase sigma factor [Alphaproteobacteria bacterium]
MATRLGLKRALVGTPLASENRDAQLSALMRAAQKGDVGAYAELLRLSIPVIKRIANSGRHFGLEIDDIVQDVLMSMHSVRHTYDPGRPFVPWLASITRHRLVDAQRRKSRINQNETAVPEIPETFSGAHPKSDMESQGDPELLKRAIAELPAGQRQAVELLKLKELSLKEASAATGMSIAALKVAVHRGLKALRLRLAGPAADVEDDQDES